MSIMLSTPLVIGPGSVTAEMMDSGVAAAGHVLTANGAAGATFAELPAAGGGILASGATVGATAQAQIFTTGVGVGASPPAAMLGVRGADSLNTSFAGNISGATGTGLVITNAGNVGIGTTGPLAKLHIFNASGDSDIKLGESLSDLMTNIRWDYTNNQAEWDTHGYSYPISIDGSSILLQSQNSGNVGIGTTSPTAALHLPASSTARASLCIPAGAAPTIPVEGDVWTASGKMYIYIGAVTKEIAFV